MGTFIKWYKGDDIKALYRINKISLQESEETIIKRQVMALGFATMIALLITQILTGVPQ